MTSNLPSSFASAAAGQNANRDARGGRGDGRGPSGGDWPRRDGRSANGTLTLRRSSTTPIGQASQSTPSTDNAVQQPLSVDTAPALSSNYEFGPARYTRDNLLEMYRPQKASDDPSGLFISGWNPTLVNGGNTRGWGKSNDNHVPQEPGACWDQNGETAPMGLRDFSMEEKEAFSTEINSPLKPPAQGKEGHQGNANGRKASVSQGSANTFGVISPSSATRPGTRRRETIESNPFSSALASPTATGRFSRDDFSPWGQRRSNELRESEPDDGDVDAGAREPSTKLPFGNLLRSNTAGATGMTSMWPSSNPATPSGGGFGNFAMPSPSTVADRRIGGAAPGGSGSRLAHLIPKETIESNDPANLPAQQSWRTRPRTDTDPFGDDELSGSAVLGGAQDTASAAHSHASRVGVLGTPVKGSTGDFGMSGLTLGTQSGHDGPASPSETNPYRSPPAERHEQDENETVGSDQPLGAGHKEPPANFGSISRGFGAPNFDGSDRSQTSSVGAKGYPLGGLSGWPAPAGPSTGTPDRERTNFGNAFGTSLFSPVGDLQSPSLSNLGNVFGAPGAGLGSGSIGRGSKLGSLFPAAMQAQMQGHDQEHAMNDPLQAHPLGVIGRGNLPGPTRDTGSPMRPNRGVFEELFPSSDSGRSHTGFSASGNPQQAGPGALQSLTPVSGGMPFGGGAQGGADPSASQVRQMVMPDRMRWVYLDPQGHMQGPFTGLEMNDWYKANFFTPDLRVRKIEDTEFEPLGQLIRRIGNSREPFLVPQIGIPHGPAPQGGPFNLTTGGGGVIPPLSGVFPSFGRTLTADEQNNLERRKQEEQQMMAHQREHMFRQQQQTLPRVPMPGTGLQHHSSAHSLQSQPSFGSMTSPIGVPPQQQPIGVGPLQHGAFPDAQTGGQPASRAGAGAGNGDPFRVDDLVGLSAAEREVLATMRGAGDEAGQEQHHATEAGLRANLPDAEQLAEDQEGFRGRLKEFQELRAQHDAEHLTGMAGEIGMETAVETPLDGFSAQRPLRAGKGKKKMSEDGTLSLTQQVQKAQAAAAASMQPAEPDMPMPFPPPSSTTPLPAPTAQRARSNLPEQYSRSQSGTPDASQPPPLAPWAKEPGQEGTKGPSLKEIQEAEARKAAKAEEAAAALRKAVIEQEVNLMREKERQAAVAAAAGLPATSTWGHGSPVSASSPWTKPGATKGTPSGPTTSSSASSKKTLADIQREEEVRKQKARDVATYSGAPVIVSKSYANLAGKPNVPPLGGIPQAVSPAAGWATVGAGGKVKVPTGPAAVPAAQVPRSLSSSNVKVQASPPVKPLIKPATTVSAIVGKSDTVNVAMEEFQKWTTRELTRGGLISDVAAFQSDLNMLPLDAGLIADAVYASSTTMDGNRFGAEYVRRKKLAEKGVVEKQSPGEAGKPAAGGGGWSEVAKRSGSTQPKDSDAGSIQGAGFKVVPSRKKGKK